MDGDHILAAAASGDQGTHKETTSAASEDVRADQLDYIADMVGELKAMARKLGATTLADLLAVTHVEAARVAARRRGVR